MKLPKTPPARLAVKIAGELRRRGHQAFLVGGCVRDLLLETVPKDFDVATSATPDEICLLFPKTGLVGAHFGVALVHEAGAAVEVATFRSDHSYRDGRRPELVRFESDPRADAMRRDFTINALFLDPHTGRVLDFAGGRSDLEARLIRTVGDPAQRFGEDHLRLLRAVRFAARLGFAIEPGTLAAIRRQRQLVRRVAAERIRDEIFRILTEGGARRGFELLEETGLLEEVLPEVAAMKGVAQPPQFHPEGDVWTHTLLMIEAMEHPSSALALGVLLHDVGKPPTYRVAERIRFDGHPKVGAEMAVRICGRFRCSAELTGRVEDLVRNHLKFMHVRQMRTSTLKRFLRQDHFSEHLELHRLDCLASHRQLAGHEFVRRKLAALSAEALRPPPLLGGAQLIAAGYTPGPAFKKMLEVVETAQLESKVRTPQEALTLVRAHFLPPDGRPADESVKPAGT